jgi:hypothetical protein
MAQFTLSGYCAGLGQAAQLPHDVGAVTSTCMRPMSILDTSMSVFELCEEFNYCLCWDKCCTIDPFLFLLCIFH